MIDSKDYYAILGISKDATPDEIRAAYKKAAKYYHPDVNGSSNANYMFSLIKEAYEHLINQSTDNSGVICSKCGKSNKQSSTFCYWCGNSLHQKQQSTTREVDPYYKKYIDLLITSVKAENYTDCLKYSSWFTEHYSQLFFGWIFRCTGLVGVHGISGINQKEYDAYLAKAKGLLQYYSKGLDFAVYSLLKVLSDRFSDEIFPIYVNCNWEYFVDHQGNNDLHDECNRLIVNTNDLTILVTEYFGLKYVINIYELMNPTAVTIRNHIVQDKWPECKSNINHGGLGDTYELCMFTQWLTQAPFFDPDIRLSLNYNAIQMLAYHKNYIPRRDAKMKKVNADYTEALKATRKSIESDLEFAKQIKKQYGKK